MLDMGFIVDIRRIIEKLPRTRQNLMFSATMPPEIRRLADSILHKPVAVQVTPPTATADRIEESVYFVQKADKPALLAHLVDNLPMSRALVFTRTKHGADRVVRHLHKCGIHAEAIHGNKSQNARQRALANFKAEKTPVLVATDIASRGIDIDDISHVVNYDISHEPETYIHRIGRTARAGAAGSAVSFCDHEERPNLKAIERLIRRPIPVKTAATVKRAAAPAAHLGLPRPQARKTGGHHRPIPGQTQPHAGHLRPSRPWHGRPRHTQTEHHRHTGAR
jgi:ATP-dependent RNA helicase RhlE